MLGTNSTEHRLAMSQQEPLSARLRRETREAHASLEASLDLLGRDMQAARMRHILERFYGFHRAWEPRLQGHPRLAGFMAPRARLRHLAGDIAALGGDPDSLDLLPICVEAAHLADDEAAALGSAYVLEGSTLGGQVIGRSLSGRSWRPRRDLDYFNPYAERTGQMWRSFKAWCDSHPAGSQPLQVIHGATRTFKVLQTWITG